MKSAKNVLPRKKKTVWSIEYFLIRLKHVSLVHEHIDDYSCLMSEFQKSIFKRAQQQKNLHFRILLRLSNNNSKVVIRWLQNIQRTNIQATINVFWQ